MHLLPLLASVALAAPLNVDINVGLGPQYLQANGALGDAQPGYLALAFDAYAVLDAKDLKQVRKRVPRKYRKMVPKKEARVGLLYIPDQILVSPSLDGGPAIWGAGWSPLSVSETLVDGKRVRVDAGLSLVATVAGIHGGTPATADTWTFFARPGLAGHAEVEVKLAKRLYLSAGYDGRAFLPQKLGGSVTELGGFDEGSLWYLGGAFAQLHVRVPKKVSM
jgi:hypothetical protein